jgi:hypothetical protein
VSIYLIEIDGYNPATAAVETLRYATRAYISRPTDTPANARYLPRLATALNLEQSMYSQGTTGGASEVGVGAVELANTDGALDGLLDFGFAGRAVRVYSIVGAKSSLASRELVFRGTVEQPEFSLERVTFRVRDRLAELDIPLCTARLRGDNDAALTPIGIEGDALDSDGQLRPVTLGWCRNVSLVCVCPQKLTYQVHDGPVKDIAWVYDSGAELGGNLVRNGDFADDSVWIKHAAWGDVVDGRQPYNSTPNNGSIYQFIDLTPGTYQIHLNMEGGSDLDIYLYRYDINTIPEPICRFSGTGNKSYTRTIGAATKYIFAVQTVTTGQTGSIDNVVIRSVVSDCPDIASLESATIPAGAYATCLAEGLIRLGASPAGEVTADVLGGIAGPNLVSNGHFDDAADWVADAGWVIHPEYNFAVKEAGNVTPIDLSQGLPIVAGATYQIRIITRLCDNPYKAGVGGAWGPSISTAGVYMATVMAINSDGLVIRGEPGFGFHVTAIEVRRIFLLGSGIESWHSPVNLLRILAVGFGRVLDADLDDDSMAAMLALNLPLIGHRFSDDSATVLSAMDAVCRDVGLWWTFTPDGRLRIGRLTLPSGEPAAEFKLRSESLESGGFERLATGDEGSGVPVWKVILQYVRNWTVQTSSLSTDQVFAQSNVAGVVSDERRAWLNAEYRTATAQDGATLVKYPAAPEMTVETGLDGRNDAQTEAARLLALFGTRRDRFRIRVPAAKARGLGLGDVIRVTFPRFGLAAGKLFTVIGRTDVLSGDQDTTDLDIWG